MKVHNLMEEYVGQRVNSLYDQMKGKNKPAWLTCDCKRCRMDATAYVLNKVHPHYIVSGRGAVYTARKLLDSQLMADVDALIMDGIKKIACTHRPNHAIMAYIDSSETNDGKAFFNFPIITGTVLNGATFEPLVNAEVLLTDENGAVVMQDSSFPNPCKTFKSTDGIYSFWPASVPAESEGNSKAFHFTVEVKAEGFGEATAGVDFTVSSDSKKRMQLGSNLTIRVQDLILFAK